jgi:hypothetical protein
MKIKFLLICAFSICCCMHLVAQDAPQPQFMSYGFRAGVNFQNITGLDVLGDDLNGKIVTRFHFGGVVDFPVAPEFVLEPGVQYTSKGAKFSSGNTTKTLNISYLEIPVSLVYRSAMNSGKLLLGFGPYVGFGIGGTAKTETNGTTDSKSIKFKSSANSADLAYNTCVKPLDAGLNFLAGYEFSNNFFFQLDAQFGLLTMIPKNTQVTNDKTKAKNFGFGISLGYRFTRKQ